MQTIPLTCLLALCLAAGPLSAAPRESTTAAAPVDAGWILDALGRADPERTGFVELRESRLLKTPLRLSGEYRRPGQQTLIREVRAPYRETTTIRAGEVTVQRGGQDPKTFSLSRAPQLAGLQSGFGALLDGDRVLLEKHYRVTAKGLRQQWTMTLVPRAGDMAKQVRDIELFGQGAELRCIETTMQGDDEPQRTLLASAARDAAKVQDAATLMALCHGDGAAAR